MTSKQRVVQAILANPANQIPGIGREQLQDLGKQIAQVACDAQAAMKEAVQRASDASKATVAAGLGSTPEERLELSITLQPLTPLTAIPASILALAYVACNDSRSLRVRGGAMRQMKTQGWYFGQYTGHPTATHSFSKVGTDREYFVALFGKKKG